MGGLPAGSSGDWEALPEGQKGREAFLESGDGFGVLKEAGSSSQRARRGWEVLPEVRE